MQQLLKKLRFKDEAVVLNAPKYLEKEFSELRFSDHFENEKKSTNTLVFLNNKEELLHFLNKQLEHVLPDSVLWLAYPKGTSKIKTDINRDSIHLTALEFDLKTVTAISVDETWSALRFRPTDKVGT